MTEFKRTSEELAKLEEVLNDLSSASSTSAPEKLESFSSAKASSTTKFERDFYVQYDTKQSEVVVPSRIAPVCARRKYLHYIGSRHYSASYIPLLVVFVSYANRLHWPYIGLLALLNRHCRGTMLLLYHTQGYKILVRYRCGLNYNDHMFIKFNIKSFLYLDP